ncbi:SPRY_PRY_C-I_1 domain-containing protein isoform X1 [Pangasianodon hypophthalmus]|uniref:SPRY_PRY_C-I_1 domain-containing protein isoform X1 n=1 Tax=Pangasianodon hypophthalmus TaxID=310915 RepID=UPI000EFF8DBB|nr:SPRY_PRY_C-I_1 domain-containing protein isoform X1 [Pangasianodon hypophthalmus]
MALSETEEYNTGAFHSHTDLENPHKEREIKRVCKSEPFIKPRMSLSLVKFIPRKILSYFKFKKPQNGPQQTDFLPGESKKIPRGLATEQFRALQGAENLREEKNTVLQELHKPRKKVQMSITDNSIQTLNKPQIDPQQTDLSLEESKTFLRGLATELYRVLQFQGVISEQMSEKAETYNRQHYYSHRNLCKEKQSKKVHSETFIRPSLSLKGTESLREEKTIELQDLYKSTKKIQMSITDISIRTLPQKNKSELPLLNQSVRSEPRSKKADGLQIPKKEWENITRPSAKVTLDPNTANPTLKLSVDGCSVRTMTYDEFQSSKRFHEYQKDKHQYNGWMCVQAQEGYSTGRHYWEVDVKGKCDWRIGVVKESAKRKGFIKLNTATGYWTLRLQLGSLMALTEPVTKLNQAPPSKIGVCLDLEEGQVSFYDAKKRKHIYTFNAEFEKGDIIYPVFGTVETDKPLKII